MSLGHRVRELRHVQGMSQTSLAEKIDVVPSYISQIERGRTKVPGLPVLQKLAHALGTTTDDLLAAAGLRNPVPQPPERSALELARELVVKLENSTTTTIKVLETRQESALTDQDLLQALPPRIAIWYEKLVEWGLPPDAEADAREAIRLYAQRYAGSGATDSTNKQPAPFRGRRTANRKNS